MMKLNTTLALLMAGAVLFTLPAAAAEYEVKMLNKGADKQTMVFEPAFLKIEPGDTVKFVPTDKTHNAETIKGMLPEGAEPFKGKVSKEVTVTFEVPGVYGYKCLPHTGMGMIGLIQVGTSMANLEEAKGVKIPGLGGKRMAALFEQLGTGDPALTQ